MHGKHLIKSWSSTQAVIALSSGESEYYGVIKGASEGLGVKSLMADWGCSREVKLWTDSSAAKGIAGRIGLSKRTRHIAVHYLWLQERVEARDLEVAKIAGEKNPADIGTKHVTSEVMEKHLAKIQVESEAVESMGQN